MATLYSDWTDTVRDITVVGPAEPINYTINIPPAKKRGPRESAKENVEVGEIAAIIKTIETSITNLSSATLAFHQVLPTRMDAMASGMQAARSKTEVE